MLCVAYLQMGQLEKAVQVTGEMIFSWTPSARPTTSSGRCCSSSRASSRPLSASTRAFLEMAASGSEVYGDAAEALQSLDEYQMHQVILLASEDRFFRQKLRQDAAEAAEERGFYFSEEGQARLQSLVQHQFLNAVTVPSVSAWGGVRFYN